VIRRVGSISAVLLLVVLAASAQNGPQYKQPEGGVPVLTGFVGLGTDFQPGQQQVLPAIAPIVLMLIWKHSLQSYGLKALDVERYLETYLDILFDGIHGTE